MRIYPFRCVALFALAFLFMLGIPSLAFSQEDSLKEVAEVGDELSLFDDVPSVFSASKYEQSITEAPSSVSVVTAEEIKRAGYTNLADILRSIRGFYISNDHNYSYLGVRGFSRPGDYNSRILLLIDGVRSNDSIYSSASAGTEFPVDIDLIDRIEIVRGPASSLYGDSAFFATINVLTKRGRDYKGFETAAVVGENKLFGGRLSYGQKYANGLELLISGTTQKTDGKDWYFKEYDAPYDNNGWAEGVDEQKFKNLFLKASIADFTLTGIYSSRDDGYPTAPWGTVFNDPAANTLDEYFITSLEYSHTTLSNWGLNAKLSYNRYYYEGYYPYDWADYDTDPNADPFILDGYDEALSEEWSASLQIGKKLGNKHRLIGGFQFNDSIRLRQKYFNYKPAEQPPGLGYAVTRQILDSDADRTIWAIYLQDEYRINDQWILNLGLRLDDYSDFGQTTNPRVALIYSPRKQTTFKLLYGTAFRAPSAYELYYNDDGVTQLANPNLDHEEIATYEIAWEEQLRDKLHLVVNGFYYDISDLIGLKHSVSGDDSSPTFFDNIDDIDAYGIEFALEGKLLNTITASFNYAYTKTENKKSGEELSNAPEHLAKLNVGVPLWNDKITLNIEELYTASRLTADLSDRVDAYWMTNLTLSTNAIMEGLHLSLRLANLFDESYDDPGSLEHIQQNLEQAGREFFLKAVYSF